MQATNTFLRITGVLSILALSSCGGQKEKEVGLNQSPIAVTVGSPAGKNGSAIQVNGRTEAKQTAELSTRLMGTITRIQVKVGDQVRQGQILATISSQDIQAKRAQTNASIVEAEAHVRNAQKDYERFSTLFNKQSATAKELENVTLQYKAAQARLEAAMQMRNEVNALMAYSSLQAPFDGVVTSRLADEGDMANPGMPILVIEQTSQLQISATVSESELPYVKKGEMAFVEIKSLEKTISCPVIEVSPSSQFTGGQYLVRLAIPESERQSIYPGMYVRVTIDAGPGYKIGPGENQVLVPESSLVKKDQLVGLYTLSSQKTALLRWVRTGKTVGDQVEILSGLSPNETFILQSDKALYNGAPVTIK